MKENFEDGETIQEEFKNVPIKITKNNDDEIYYMHSNIHSGFSYLKYYYLLLLFSLKECY